MMMLLSPAESVANELAVVHALFEKGLPLFHIRKYAFTDMEMAADLEDIKPSFRKQLVLHSHFHMASDLGIERLHIREEDRQRDIQLAFMTRFILSTSVHAITTFNTLDTLWDYAFLSPVFPSISKKGYGLTHTVLDDLHLRSNPQVRLVGLGGINEQNHSQVFAAGADAIALLGAVWNSPEPVQVLESIIRNNFLMKRWRDKKQDPRY